MWIIIEAAGMICAFLTYVIVLTVQLGFLRIGIWESLLAGEPWAFIHLLIFQYHVALIFWAHFKCMTTEPGVLPKEYEDLDFQKLAPGLQDAIKMIQYEVIREDQNPKVEQPDEVILKAAPVDFSKSVEEVNAAVAASK